MCSNNFAAIVSDNDGSAFITKAEFDSLKNDFQTQINQYNTSIDNKIDGAIAAYLAGIQVAKKSTLKSLIENLSADRRTFRSASWNNYNSRNVVAGDAGIQIVRMRGFFNFVNISGGPYYGLYVRILLNSGNDFQTISNYSSQPTYGWWTKVQYDNDMGIYYVPDQYQVREIMHYRATNGFFGSQYINESDWTWDASLDETNTVLTNTNTSPEPIKKTFRAKIPGELVDYVAATTATFENGTASTNFVGNLNSQSFSVVPSTSYWFLDGDNLSTFTDAKKFSLTTKVYRRNAQVYKRDASNVVTEVKSWNNNEADGTITTYSAKKMQLALTNIKNHTLSNIAGETVELYGGLPMCYLPGKTGKMKFNISLSQDAVVCLNYGQFDNSELSIADTDYDKNYGVIGAGTHQLELDMSDTKWNGRDEILWLKVNRTNSSVSAITINVSNIEFETEA